MSRHRAVLLVAAAVAAVVASAAVLIGLGARGSDTAPAAAPAGPSTTSPSSTGESPRTAPTPVTADPAGTRPVRVRIASIDVDSTLQDLGTTSSGALQTPSQWQRAGWYAGGVRPGATGPAVIAGHVDSRKGPAVFARLTALRAGASVLVTRADGSVLRFVVDRTQRYAKKQFPTQDVYGPSSLPLLRLITCTGTFDPSARSYLDNLVVTTHLVAS